jgi:Ca2+:H+ antiporter
VCEVSHASQYIFLVRDTLKNQVEDVIFGLVRSSVELCGLVAPLLVVLGWALSVNLTLNFPFFEAVVLFVSVLFIQKKLHDGYTLWYDGMLMVFGFVIASVAFFFHPDP